jgi:hypothetical protein
MRRTLPFGPVALALLLASTAACRTDSPSAPDDGGAPLSAPVIVQPQCGAPAIWPTAPITLAWRALTSAATYTVELDCMNCGNRLDPWVSQSGTPWQIRSGLASPSYMTDAITTLRREGGRALRWRVWGVDNQGREGTKTDWCVTSFSDTGNPTPGAGTP